MGKKLRRKPCDGMNCNAPAFFGSPSKSAGVDPFFKPTASADVPAIQKEDAPDAPKQEEEKKDPMVEGLKITGEQLFKHEPFKRWFKKQYAPLLGHLKADFWDHTSGGEKALLLSYAGINLGMAGLAFAQSPEWRKTLSGVNIGAPLGWIPYSPIDGFKYKPPGAGKSDLGLSADFTFNSYLEALRKQVPGMPLTGATFGLESAYDPSGKGFSLTGGKFGLEFLGGGLKAEGKTFNELTPYPMWTPGGQPGEPGSWLRRSVPDLPPMMTGPGLQFMVNADLLKLFPALQPIF
jgi:hypothetical protein